MGWEEILSRNSGVGKMGVLTPQLQAKSWRAKPLNFQKISFGVVPHTILLGIRGSTKFFGQLTHSTIQGIHEVHSFSIENPTSKMS